jgi:F-type H+-transporting ATPase subunit epsilon
MPATFQFQLVTPTGVVFDGAVEQVTAHGPLGEFGVLADHTNFVTSLVPGVVTLRLADGGSRSFVVSGGLVEVRDGTMTMLADGAQRPQSLDRASAEEAERAAESRIASMSTYDPDYAAAEHELMLARARREATAAR